MNDALLFQLVPLHFVLAVLAAAPALAPVALLLLSLLLSATSEDLGVYCLAGKTSSVYCAPGKDLGFFKPSR